MTSTSTIRKELPQFAGRTVRDVVEYQHELVSEVWCRKIFRQVLQSLELQYAAGMPHRAITPDTIVFQENGEPLLLPSDRHAAETGIPADLHALACVIHYAITLELSPQAPLRGRALEGYSDSLTGAVDQCLSPDPGERPQTIDELRNLLGIVSLGPPVAVERAASHLAGAQLAPGSLDAVSSPATVSSPAVGSPLASVSPLAAAALPGKFQRWLLIGLAALVLLAAVMALVALLRGTASHDAVVLTLPPQGAPGADPAAPGAPVPGSATASTTPQSLPPAAATQPSAALAAPQQLPSDAAAQPPAPLAPPQQPPLPPAGQRPGDLAAQGHAPAAAPSTARRAQPATRIAREPAATTTTYKLMIKPWGTVYVDGEERGVSPPLKHLSLGAGQHTVRVVNPNFRDYVIRVGSGANPSDRIVHDFSKH